MSTEYKNIKEKGFNNDEVSLGEIIIKIKEFSSYLKSKWKVVLLSCIICSLIGFSIALIEKPRYKAVLTFAMEEDKGNSSGGLSGALGLASSFGIDLGGGGGGGAFAAPNLSELMKSHLIIEKVLLSPCIIYGRQSTLAEYYLELNNYRKKWKNDESLRNIKFLSSDVRENYSIEKDSILKIVYEELLENGKLNITQKDKKITILTISVTNEDELFAKLFCEKLAKETSSFYVQTKSKKARLNVDVLQKQVDSVKIELGNSINNVASEVDNFYNLNPAYNIKGALSKRKQVDVQANTAILTNLVVQLELAKITLRKETPLIQLIDVPTLPLEKDKINSFIAIIIGFMTGLVLSILYYFLNIILKSALKKD